MCIILGLVMYGSRAGYFTFIVRPGAIVSLAIVITILVLGIRAARAETNEAFILNSFPHCRSEPVFSPYPAGAIGAIEAKRRADWYAKQKPILGAPCVLPTDYGVTFCDKFVCRNIELR
jgi:hypothetical protein